MSRYLPSHKADEMLHVEPVDSYWYDKRLELAKKQAKKKKGKCTDIKPLIINPKWGKCYAGREECYS